jgi:hypothetical protein
MKTAAIAAAAALAAAGALWPRAVPQAEWVPTALEFDAKGVLYVADARNDRIVAIELGEKAGKAEAVKVEDLADQLASALGAKADEIQVGDVAVSPVSGAVVVSALTQNGSKAGLFRVVKGKLQAIETKGLKTSSASLPKGVQPLDLVVTPKGLVVSSVSRDKTFLARLHRVDLPVKDGAVATAESELYHTSHEAWETQAPLLAMAAYTKGASTYVLGSTACTPVVRLGADEVADKKKVKTTTICELGMGNAPVSLVVCAKEKKDFLIVSSEVDGTFKIDGPILSDADKINEKAVNRNKGEAPGVAVVKGWDKVRKMALLDAKSVVAVKAEGKLTLETLELP